MVPPVVSLWPQFCLMTHNLSVKDYDDCLDLDPKLATLTPYEPPTPNFLA